MSKKWRFKYLIGSILLIIFSLFVFLWSNYEKRIYLLFDENHVNCTNVIQRYTDNYYVICEKDRTMLFVKLENTETKIKDLSELESLKIMSKEKLFQEFEDSILFGKVGNTTVNNKSKIYLVQVNKSDSTLKIIRVKQVAILG